MPVDSHMKAEKPLAAGSHHMVFWGPWPFEIT